MAQEVLNEIQQAREQEITQKPVGKAKGWGTPINGVELTNEMQHAICSRINTKKTEYFSSPAFHWYRQRVQALQYYVNQELPPGKRNTRFGLIQSKMRSSYDYYLDSLCDLFDVDDLIVCLPASGAIDESGFAEGMQIFINRLLKSVNYKSHLFERFRYLPDFGWSIAHDSYQINAGFSVKAKASSIVPGLEGFDFTAEMDPLLDGPKCEIVKPLDWFGDIFHNCLHQNQQGFISRFYINDFQQAMAMQDAEGNPLYNVEACQSEIEAISRGARNSDPYKSSVDGNNVWRSQFDREQTRNITGYTDVLKWYGTLEGVKGFENDPNCYYIECTQSQLLRIQENPRDRVTMFTHMQTHPLRDIPFTRSWLDSVTEHQKFGDTILNITLENAFDSAHRIWTYFEEDIINYNELHNPQALQTFLQMQGNGRPPQLVNDKQSGSLSDLRGLYELIDRDGQKGTVTDQDLGVGGNDRTATGSRILASAQTKKVRAAVKRFMPDAIIPQIKNIVMMEFVHGNPLRRKMFSKDGKEIKLTQEHINWYFQNADLQLNDTITRDWNDVSQRVQGAMQMAQSVLPNLTDPQHMVKAMRTQFKWGGVPDSIVDDILPAPLDPNSEEAQTQAGQQLQQLQQENEQLKQQLQQLQPLADKGQIAAQKAQTDAQLKQAQIQQDGMINQQKIEIDKFNADTNRQKMLLGGR